MNHQTYEILAYTTIKEEMKNYCASSLGKEKIDELEPASSAHVVKRLLGETKEALVILDSLERSPLYSIRDIKPLLQKVKIGSVLRPNELVEVADFLRGIRMTKKTLAKFEYQAPHLFNYSLALPEKEEVEKEILNAIAGDEVLSSASKELGRIRKQMSIVEERIEGRLQKMIKSSEYASYIQDPVIQQRNGQYVLSVKSPYKAKVRGQVVDSSSSGSTVFIRPDTISKFIEELALLRVNEEEEIYQILAFLTSFIASDLEEISNGIELLTILDFIFARGRYTKSIGGVEVKITGQEQLAFYGAKHPLLGKEAVGNDLFLGGDFRGMMITGPNTGGKTITLKTMGLSVLMVQSGIFPIVKEGSEMSVFSHVLVDMGDGQDISASLSTFSSHMKSLKGMMQRAGRNTLCLVDEIGTGTDPREGAALGIAILEHLYERGALVAASSHYGEIKAFAESHGDFINTSMSFNPTTFAPTYHLKYGAHGKSNGIRIAEILEMPDKVLRNARKYLKKESEEVAYQQVQKKKFKMKKEEEVNTQRVTYQRGDQVLLLDRNEKALIAKQYIHKPFVQVFLEGSYYDIHLDRVKLTFSREVLYPEGYDLEQLFEDFHKRKLMRDLEKKRIHKLEDINEVLNR